MTSNAFLGSVIYRVVAGDGSTQDYTVTAGTPVQQAYLKASNADARDFFGSAVAVSADGNTLAVGAYAERSAATGINGDQSDNSIGDNGAVYVFTRSGNAWSQQAYLKASNANPALLSFGDSVSLSADGNTLAVGASGEDSAATGVGGNPGGNLTDSGAVYVFTRSGGAWSQQGYIKASNTDAGDFFGGSVGLSADGNTLVVGAAGEDSASFGIGSYQGGNSALSSGAVYVFARFGNAWSQQAYVKASNTEAGDYFGGRVAVSADGNTFAVGSFLEDSAAAGIDGNQGDNGASNSGAVYVFTRSGAVWRQQGYVKAWNTDSGDNFGESMTLSADGNTLAVGARNEASAATGIDGNRSDNSAPNSGAVYVFTRSGTVWSQQAYVKASNTGTNDSFGESVALSADGNALAVGAGGEASAATGIGGNEGDNAAARSGAVYLVTRSGTVWSQQAYIKASNTDEADRFGACVALSADGITLAVGGESESSVGKGVNDNNTQSDNTKPFSGAVYVFH
jgi:hypothetical protein